VYLTSYVPSPHSFFAKVPTKCFHYHEDKIMTIQNIFFFLLVVFCLCRQRIYQYDVSVLTVSDPENQLLISSLVPT